MWDRTVRSTPFFALGNIPDDLALDLWSSGGRPPAVCYNGFKNNSTGGLMNLQLAQQPSMQFIPPSQPGIFGADAARDPAIPASILGSAPEGRLSEVQGSPEPSTRKTLVQAPLLLASILGFADQGPASEAQEALERAKACEANGDLRGAAEAYRILARLKPTPEAHLVLGGIYFQLGDYQRMASAMTRSLDSFRKARKRSRPAAPETEVGAYYGLALAHTLMGKTNRALAEVTSAVRLNAKDAGVRLLSGYIRELSGQWEAAIEEYEETTRLDPQLEDPYLHVGNIHAGLADQMADESRRREHHDAAIAAYRAFLNRFPNSNSSVVHNNIGVLLSRVGRYDAALDEYIAAVEADPQNMAAASNLGLAYIACGRFEEAVQAYERSFMVWERGRGTLSDEQGGHILNGLGMALAKQYEQGAPPDADILDRAETALLKAIELNPRNSDARNNLGTIYAESGGWEEAENQFDAILHYDPQNMQAQSALHDIAIRRYSPGPPDDPKEQERIRKTLRLLGRLREEGDEEEQRETFARLKQALEEDRLLGRRLFSE